MKKLLIAAMLVVGVASSIAVAPAHANSRQDAIEAAEQAAEEANDAARKARDAADEAETAAENLKNDE
jgi:type II secretory pathway pseudopilin PulG